MSSLLYRQRAIHDPSGILGGVAIPYWLGTTQLATAALPKPQHTATHVSKMDTEKEIAQLCSNLMETAKYGSSACRSEIMKGLRGVTNNVSAFVNRDINSLILNIDTSSSSSSSSANQVCNPLLKEQTPQPGRPKKNM